MKKLLKVSDVAELAGFHIQTVYAMCYQHRIPHTRIGGALRFDPDKIEEWIKGREVAADAHQR